MGVLQRVASALGFPTGGASSLSSPWASSDGLADVDLASLFYLGENVRPTRGNAMKLSVVSRVRNVVAPAIGGLPLVPVDKLGVPGVPTTFLAQPDPARPRSQTLTWTVDQLMFYPSAWWRCTRRDAFGWPLDAYLVAQHDVQLDAKGNLLAVEGHPVDDKQPDGWKPRDLFRFDSPHSGLLVDGARILSRAYAIEMAAAKAEDNPVPAFELHNNGEALSNEEIAKRVESWILNRRRYSVGWTEKNIESKALGVAPEQLLIDGRKRVDLELVRHMNAAAWVADVPVEGTSLTYANLTDKGRDLVNFSLAPYMTAITDRLGMPDITPRGTSVTFNTDALTRPDIAARFTYYKTGKDGGFVTNEQIAQWEGWQTGGAQ